jgi:ankyrin repeat protein
MKKKTVAGRGSASWSDDDGYHSETSSYRSSEHSAYSSSSSSSPRAEEQSPDVIARDNEIRATTEGKLVFRLANTRSVGGKREVWGNRSPSMEGAICVGRAARAGLAEVVTFLLEAGEDPEGVDELGRSPLRLAAGWGHVAVARALCEAGVDVDRTDSDGVTPLTMASQNGHAAMVRFLLRRAGADVNKPKLDGVTPLYISAQNGHLAVVEVLLEAAADVEKANKSGATALMRACQNNHLPIVKTLVGAGATVYDPARHEFASRSPMGIAASQDLVDILLFLLESAQEAAAAAGGFSPARLEPAAVLAEVFGCAVRNAETLRFRGELLYRIMLLPRDSLVDLEAQDDAGHTPLANAREIGDPVARSRVTQLLCACGATIVSAVETRRNESCGNTALHAVAFQNDEMGHWLNLKPYFNDSEAERAEAVNSTDDAHGRTPLHHACFRGLLEMVTELLDAGARVDVFDKHGFTPVHDLAVNLDPEEIGTGDKVTQTEAALVSVVDLLESRGLLTASLVGSRNRAGHTAADIARQHGGALLAARLERISGSTLAHRFVLAPLRYILLFLLCVLFSPIGATLLSLSLFSRGPLGAVFARAQANLELHPLVTLAGSLVVSTGVAVIYLVVPRQLGDPGVYLLAAVSTLLLLPSAFIQLRVVAHRAKATPQYWRPGTLFLTVPDPPSRVTLWSRDKEVRYPLPGVKIKIPLNWTNLLALVSLAVSFWQSLSITFLPKNFWTSDPKASWVSISYRGLFSFSVTYSYLNSFWAAVAVTVLALAFFTFVVIGMASSIVPFGSKRGDVFASLSRAFPFITRDFLSKLPLGSELAGLLSGLGLNLVSSVFLKALACDDDGVFVKALLPDELLVCHSTRHLFLAGFGSLLLVIYSAAALTMGLAFIRDFDGVEDIRITAAYQLVSNFAQVVGIVLGIFLEGNAQVVQIYTIITYTVFFLVSIWHQPCRDIKLINLWLAWSNFAVAWLGASNLMSIKLGPSDTYKKTGVYTLYDLYPMILLLAGWGVSLLVALFAAIAMRKKSNNRSIGK